MDQQHASNSYIMPLNFFLIGPEMYPVNVFNIVCLTNCQLVVSEKTFLKLRITLTKIRYIYLRLLGSRISEFGIAPVLSRCTVIHKCHMRNAESVMLGSPATALAHHLPNIRASFISEQAIPEPYIYTRRGRCTQVWLRIATLAK